ncbi:hypothetical protein FNV43_RR07990 [Rhamnella rubrinervis]|uniref:Uncharacterized protein n=1 Tax=Rhamnella rubrinervis TaxID=2594499 RepID=A0A8K0MMY8_9ROSA|nr:hypothetical protein FNV43_RR07990 [Rhamnella rubrinervis]
MTVDLENGSEVVYIPKFLSFDDAWKWFEYLNNDSHFPWTRPTLCTFGKYGVQCKDSCNAASPGLKGFVCCGYQLHAYPWDDYPPPVKLLLEAVHDALRGISFNSLFLNRYKGDNDNAGWYSVDLKLYGLTPEIATVSMGYEPDFLLRRNSTKLASTSVDFLKAQEHPSLTSDDPMAPRSSPSSYSIEPRDVCIVGVARTPMGGLLGSLSSFSATQLGSLVIRSALERANVDPSLVQEVFFGNVLSANLGQAPARQAALGAGMPNSVICTTINKVCASGMKATMIAAQSIQLGMNDIVVVGGMESMSNAPKYLPAARNGSRFGHDTIVDGMLKDGLWDVYNDFGMGVCAELCASQHNISRKEQDSYAIRSFERGISAQNGGLFAWEIVPVEIPGGRGRPSTIVSKDEGLEKFDASKLLKLRPTFIENGGSVTAGNASSISDGAAALVLVSGAKALQLGLHIIAKIKGYADAAKAPELFTTAPALAIPKAISNSGLKPSQVDYYEINEAFSVVALANQKLLGLHPDTVNVHGGAVSLGHPLGCSGARILVTLLGVLRHRNGKYGVASICNGGGGASALVLELVSVAKAGPSKL